MKLLKRILPFVIAVLGLVGCDILGGEESFKKEAYRNLFPDGEHALVISHVGDTEVPDADDIIEIKVVETVFYGDKYTDKEIASDVFVVNNGGNPGEFFVQWFQSYVQITLVGSGMDKNIVVTINYATPDVINVAK